MYSTIRTCRARVRSNAINVSLPVRSRSRSLHKVLHELRFRRPFGEASALKGR